MAGFEVFHPVIEGFMAGCGVFCPVIEVFMAGFGGKTNNEK